MLNSSGAEKLELSPVVLVVATRAHFPEMYRTARELALGARFRPTVVFAGEEDLSREQETCLATGLHFVVHDVETATPAKIRSFSHTATDLSLGGATTFKRRLRNLPVIGAMLQKFRGYWLRTVVRRQSVLWLPWHIARLRRLNRRALELLTTLKPRTVMLPHVELGQFIGSVVHEAGLLGIRTVVIPYTWIFREELLPALVGKAEFQARGPMNRWVSRKYPQWAFRDHLFLPAVNVLALESLKMAPPNPWMGDCMADVVVLDSPVTLRSYLADGVPAEKCRVTGSAALDSLAKARLRAMEHGTGRSEFVLCFLPPDQTPNRIPGFEYSNYMEMLASWIEIASQHAVPVIFSMHPRMYGLKERIRAAFPDIGLYEGDACDLIPSARFCVGQFGGMMRYALACGKPVLYYDVFKYEVVDNEFVAAPSVVTVRSRHEFALAYGRLISDNIYHAELQASAAAASDEWGRLDGRAMERIEAILAGE